MRYLRKNILVCLSIALLSIKYLCPFAYFAIQNALYIHLSAYETNKKD